MDYTFDFGKHKDTSMEELKKTNPKYLIWLNKQPWIKDELEKALSIHLNDVVLDFGRHKGATIGYVRNYHPKYYDWLMKKDEPKDV